MEFFAYRRWLSQRGNEHGTGHQLDDQKQGDCAWRADPFSLGLEGAVEEEAALEYEAQRACGRDDGELQRRSELQAIACAALRHL